MIGVDVSVDHVGDLHLLGGRECDVGVNVALVRVDHGALAESAAAEQVAGAAGLEGLEGPEDHGWVSSLVSIGQPWLRQSATPWSMRVASYPCRFSRSTASAAYTQ